ncbi:MAG: 1-acyl-sn-glycerol-3-phosphate acyltransferase [Spirochaetales bacterium]|nr:1-acyl-sn-glycerol-3-phosphate acyltransferase [Spirochaetales bacterium]
MAYRSGDEILRFSPSFLPFTAAYYLLLPLVMAIDRLLFRLRVIGRENLAGLRQAVLVSNHTLLMDPAVIAHAIRPRRTYFTMLEETALFPFLGTFVRLLGAIPIPERPASLRILQKNLARALDHLGFVHFFPEGECYRWSQEVRPLRLGALTLAARLGVPVVPITTVLHEQRWLGRRSVCVLGRRLRVPPRVTVVIGEPVDVGVLVGGVDRRRLVCMANRMRRQMQAVIDAAGGCRGLYRGQMPRLSAARHLPGRFPVTEHPLQGCGGQEGEQGQCGQKGEGQELRVLQQTAAGRKGGADPGRRDQGHPDRPSWYAHEHRRRQAERHEHHRHGVVPAKRRRVRGVEVGPDAADVGDPHAQNGQGQQHEGYQQPVPPDHPDHRRYREPQESGVQGHEKQ